MWHKRSNPHRRPGGPLIRRHDRAKITLMTRALLACAAASLLLAGCVTESAPQYSLTGSETGIFRSANAGRPIAVSEIKGMDERQLTATFGAARLDRKDATSRVLRYQSEIGRAH